MRSDAGFYIGRVATKCSDLIVVRSHREIVFSTRNSQRFGGNGDPPCIGFRAIQRSKNAAFKLARNDIVFPSLNPNDRDRLGAQ
jgi:hypothetical protein